MQTLPGIPQGAPPPLSRQARRQRERQALKDDRRAVTDRANYMRASKESKARFVGSAPKYYAREPEPQRFHLRLREYARRIKRDATQRLRAESLADTFGPQAEAKREAWQALARLPLSAFVAQMRAEIEKQARIAARVAKANPPDAAGFAR